MLYARICKAIKEGKTGHKNELDIIQLKNLINRHISIQNYRTF